MIDVTATSVVPSYLPMQDLWNLGVPVFLSITCPYCLQLVVYKPMYQNEDLPQMLLALELTCVVSCTPQVGRTSSSTALQVHPKQSQSIQDI
jgi:hypothetical protein